jgi:hypothetical protein
MASNNYDAVAFANASLARKLICGRKAAGRSQAELARLAKIPLEPLGRIERLGLIPSTAIVAKINRSLAKATAK